MLLAMATGTGKTKTCIALIYRLLKFKRFKRILFLVDRSALGEQAANAFKDTRMENLQNFADIFSIKELEDQAPDDDTAVHIATVQGMVKRALYPGEDQPPIPVDRYDCIVVDECHRGYLLDREMSDTELAFRSYDDYISKYRRVLEYFDAVKIGLTATPALHTVQIFGDPVFTYSYRKAVVEGYLVDHVPPAQITTELSRYGIQWNKGDEVKAYNPRTNEVQLYHAPDAIKVNVDAFNRRVITEDFNRAVCRWLAKQLEPNSNQKTLVFCVNDMHADLVVQLLKEEFENVYGELDDDAVLKITGNSDKPLELIRRFKNEHYPNVAVTVDLLTTGIDVPQICNLVFVRRVNSRILFDQMLGRATRLCPEIQKETFSVFDAVGMYESIKDMTAMRPVVVNPSVTFAQLAGELATIQSDAHVELARDQFVAKLHRKKRLLSERALRDFESRAGQAPDDFIHRLLQMPLSEIAAWFTQNPDLGEILDRTGEGPDRLLLISDKPDQILSVDYSYPNAVRPADYLEAFTDYIKTHHDEIPALVTVLTRPRDLTRRQLRDLMLALDGAGFTEANLNTAWRQMNNEEMAARIIGLIRKIALGETLLPYDQRVEQALGRLLRSREWTKPQQDWLRRIADQTKTNMIVDLEVLDDPDQVFRREGGGFQRLNKMFNGELGQILADLNDAVWQAHQ
jgi:type I restriction enzyme R subunit